LFAGTGTHCQLTKSHACKTILRALLFLEKHSTTVVVIIVVLMHCWSSHGVRGAQNCEIKMNTNYLNIT